MGKSSIFSLLILFIWACGPTTDSTAESKIFRALDPSSSQVGFTNTLTETDSLNYFNYSYIYMGGGVSAGDVNNDGLTDLFFTGNMVANKLYLNQGNLQFKDISNAAQIAGDNRWYTGTTMVDINADGHMDIYCSVGGKNGNKKNQLFLNNGDGTFSEKAEALGIADAGNSVQGVFFDYDRDGDLDLYVANYPPTPFNAPNQYYKFKQDYLKYIESDRLYRNDGSSFTDVTKKAGLLSYGLTLSASVGDLNNDGWPDIYVSNDFSTPDYLFMNNGDGTFSDTAQESMKNTSFYGMGADMADFNNDGLLDLFQLDMSAKNNRRAKANMASMNPDLFWSTVNAGFHYQYMQNSLQLNNGNLRGNIPDFSNVARISGLASTDWSWAPLFADLDNDGRKDLFVANGTRREINNRDYFIALEKKQISKDSFLQMSMAIPSEPIDNFVFQNKGGLKFEKANKKWGLEYKGFSNGTVYADLDNDGDLEIVINNIDAPASIFENTGIKENRYLQLAFKGDSLNPQGIGAKISIYEGGQLQMQELMLSRGFQSSVPPLLHFGLGNAQQVDSVRVQWPDGKYQLLKNIETNHKLTLAYTDATSLKSSARNDNTLFSSPLENDFLRHKHEENYYDDFDKEILLPHKTSNFGPDVAVADLNKDGKDDLVVGGASGQPTTVYFQTESGFKPTNESVFEGDRGKEDIGIHIFDADNDNLLDIYIVSGGNEFAPDSPQLQDRLYRNNGDGTFTKTDSALPQMISSGGRVASFDYDKDGDLDLFVGGRLVPGNYPSPAQSFLLENQSTTGNPKFVDSSHKLPNAQKLGMVTDALWTDFNQDGWTDLIIVGEWMPITIFKNNQGQFTDETENFGLSDTRGWWFSLAQADFDQDGDMDYVLGNLGENYKYKAKDDATFDIFFNDFDGNQTNDIVLSYHNDGTQFPVRGRECSSQQMPAIKSKFKDYNSFSTATLKDIYTEKELDESLHYSVKSFASVYLENTGSGFKRHQLPVMAQLSSINQILVDDFDQNGTQDVLVAGNLHASEVETPRNDAGIGLLLSGDGKGGFTPIEARNSGFYTPGDVKDMKPIRIDGQNYIVAAKNNDYLQFVKRK
ncbi:FG-GAP-like repeat-containing protein [Sediminicola luteus]|uniref:ASPIC/UnbV domain-containing protein n=1 Tax=Sediminicola luteus TaxID=319238 RepID=A0A2A4G0P9_9FLAO|nr:FG-GAP-like repeat-containing protein [Sediminicola luteus]PCE62569.1 hypothetical protein B7P33_18200 [Sediminicola luteus]